MGPKWNTFKDYSNSKGGESGFEYSDSTEKNIHKEGQWPELGYQENPVKE